MWERGRRHVIRGGGGEDSSGGAGIGEETRVRGGGVDAVGDGRLDLTCHGRLSTKKRTKSD